MESRRQNASVRLHQGQINRGWIDERGLKWCPKDINDGGGR